MIERLTFTGPRYGRDNEGRFRSWPLAHGPAPEDLDLAGWERLPADEPLPVLVQPGVLHDPMEVESRWLPST